MRRSHNIDYRGNTHDRRVRRAWLLAHFGNGRILTCHWCSRRMRTLFEVDRYPNPRGRYTRDNIVPACPRCNRRRGMGLAPYVTK